MFDDFNENSADPVCVNAPNFAPFQSLIGERKAEEFIDKYAKCKTIVTEKIHGCNFSVYLNNDGKIWFASRNHILEENSNLFNFRSYFTKEKCANLSKLAKITLQSGGNTLRFIGELFGNKVQKEIKYCEHVDFNVFYIELDNKPLTWSDDEENMTVTNLSNAFNFATVPVIAIGCLDEMYSMDIGFSQIATDSICEGYCYRVIGGTAYGGRDQGSRFAAGAEGDPTSGPKGNTIDTEEAFTATEDERSEARGHGKENESKILPIILKKRSQNYLETIKEFSEDMDIVQQIRSCITRQRILNILSKGFRGNMNVTKLTFLMWKDIFNEFNGISKNYQKKIQKLYGNEATNIITQVLDTNE